MKTYIKEDFKFFYFWIDPNSEDHCLLADTEECDSSDLVNLTEFIVPNTFRIDSDILCMVYPRLSCFADFISGALKCWEEFNVPSRNDSYYSIRRISGGFIVR